MQNDLCGCLAPLRDVVDYETGADPGNNLTGLLETERRIYGSPEANIFRFSLSKIIFPSILSYLESLTDFRKTV